MTYSKEIPTESAKERPQAFRKVNYKIKGLETTTSSHVPKFR